MSRDGLDGVAEVPGAVDGEGEGQLLARERVVRADARLLHEEEPRRAGLLREVRHGGEDPRVLGDHVPVQLAADPQAVPDLPLLLGAGAVGALGLQRGDGGVVDRIDDDDGVLRRARRGVVEGLGEADLGRRVGEVGGLVDDRGGVAEADADRRPAAAVGPAHVVLGARHHHEVRGVHQLLGERLGHPRQDLHEVLRVARAGQLVPHHPGHPGGRGQAGRGGGEDDRVPPLDRQHRLVDRRRRRVRRGTDGGDHADGLGVLHQPAAGKLLDDADGPGALPQEVAQGAEGLAAVLDDLVRDVAEPGVPDRDLRQLAGALGLVDRPGEGGDGVVDGVLAGVGERRHGGAGAGDQSGDRRVLLGVAVDGVDGFLQRHGLFPALPVPGRPRNIA